MNSEEGLYLKKWIWLVITIVIAASVGGYAYARHSQNEKLYSDAMDRASLQISNKRYIAAETAYTNALKRKPNDEKATRLLSQTQNFMAANDLFNQRQFAGAKNSYQSVVATKNGNETLKGRANDRLKLVKTIQSNLKRYNKLYSQALNETGEGNYAQSNSTLDKILSDTAIKQTYYKTIYNKAKQLQTKNNAALNGTAATSSSSDFESSTSNSSTQNTPNVAPSSSASLTSSEQKAADAYKGSNEYTVNPKQNEIDGQSITAAQVNTARHEISAAGIDSNAMSDQDVKNIIKGAHNNNESVGQYVKEKY
ncbi:hypothetical protein HMPREF9103_00523 [Lentilactobacillus parafarraginis F0439]|uniref:Tetratricopeptide repeat protein n=1 Tax=Lentilactobacillus parafarraginis F0439 TaxID=797515 RepID=G9ZLC5_9LACO|nr:hypothetical protein HMPREF9103_00523 [Lentilactobacillus parafarraginis F0439]